MKRIVTLVCFVLLFGRMVPAVEPRTLALENDHLRATFDLDDGAWRLSRLARTDGSDALDLASDEFEILLLDDSRFTVSDYQADSRCSLREQNAGSDSERNARSGGNQNVGSRSEPRLNGRQILQTTYGPKPNTGTGAPKSVTVTYSLGAGPFVHKAVDLTLEEGDTVDRLQVLRFSCDEKASRGGEGQPVFIGNWFFGLDYPGFHSRHSDAFREPDFRYKWHYTIDFDGRDREFEPRDGLVTLFHFPGEAKRQPGKSWGIHGKRAVMGLSRKKGENAELALIDYIDQTRLPPRGYLHFNNWYSARAKTLDPAVFVDDIARTIQTRMTAHGANLDGMVPDHGWENTKTYSRIFEPKHGLDLAALQKALAKIDVGLGLWMAIDGTNAGYGRGLQIGYKPAYVDGFDRSWRAWMSGNKLYFDVLDPKYQSDLRRSLRHMIVDGKINYIKHDFNHNFSTTRLSQRHAREACLDVTLDLLAYERELNPGIFQNYTNGSWFSPWWFQHVHTIWMMSGDSGGNGAWPQLSLRDGATAYRDSWLYQSFNNPGRCARPVVRIADLMTHGILLTKRKPFTDFKDTLYDWSNYVVMYYARGTTLKELYIDNELLDDEHWKVLATASAWARASRHRLRNTVLIGGDCGAGEVYGYVSWVNHKAVLTARNPDRRAQSLEVPFDASVYYRGEPGRPYRARVVYPFIEEMPWSFTSGRAFSIDVPGDSILVMEIEPGDPLVERAAAASPLPAARADVTEESFTIRLPVPDEDLMRYDVLVQVWGTAISEVTVDGKPVEPRRQDGGRWTLSAYDLRPYRGRTLTLQGRLVPSSNPQLAKNGKVQMEAWVIADRRVEAPSAPTAEKLPWPISQRYRRSTQQLIREASFGVR